MEENVFVGRDHELARLDSFLKDALHDKGLVCFVAGEAGCGKTTLVTEFARRAQELNNTLAVAFGQSDAYTGLGDAHLPFREVLGQLTGDVEKKLAQGAITKENANRLRKLLVLSGQALVEVGPDLIGIFVPGIGLATRVGAFAAEKVGWLEKLEGLIRKNQEGLKSSETGIEQSHIFEQYSNVLVKLSEKQPLLLVLDDLQWADAASIELLFHLGRRIAGNKILIIGTYRPEEVAIGRAEERHPLEKVLAEFKRYYGDIWVDLDQAMEVEGYQFVNAFLDTEPNQLEDLFRERLFQHTGGHPLFTIELLRNMQERGDLIQDDGGQWVETAALDWTSLPERVEGVIEERIGRLEGELRQILTIGCVEGEKFTAEVVSRVQAAEARSLIQRLSGQLERQHRLVRSRGTRQLEPTGQRLSLYQFQHNLFQKYLYNELSEAERAYLHVDVGNALEALYGDQSNEIAVQLARHFEEAGISEKARPYMEQAGRQAANRFANEEAIRYFSKALELTPENEVEERFDLLLAREQVYNLQGARECQAKDLATLKELVQIIIDDQKQAEVALRQASYAQSVGDFQKALADTQKVINLAQNVNTRGIQVKAYILGGLVLRNQGNYQAAHRQLELAKSLAQNAQLSSLEAESLCGLGKLFSREGDTAKTQAYCEQARQIYQELGDMRGEAEALLILCATFLDHGDYSRAKISGEKALQIYQQIGYRQREADILGNLGIIYAQQGENTQAKQCFQHMLKISQETGNRQGQAAVLNNLGNLALRQAEYDEAKDCFEQVLGICREIGHKRGEGISLHNLGTVSERRGHIAIAMSYHTQALNVFRMIGDSLSEARVLGNLGDLHRAEGDLSQARTYLEQCLRISREVKDRQTEAVSLDYLGNLSMMYGMYAESQTYLQQSLEITREISDSQLEGRVLANLSWLSIRLNEYDSALGYGKQAFLLSQKLEDLDNQGLAWTISGYIQEAKRSFPEAINAYKQALAFRRKLNQPHLATEPLAGLARLNMLMDNLTEAQILVEEMLDYLKCGSLDGTEEPIRIYLTCYQVLRANQDPRAEEILKTGYEMLQERAEKIEDETLRRSYLENVPAHREIIQEAVKFLRIDQPGKGLNSKMSADIP